jgi:DNA-binding FadR family transcriptional regulator
MKGWSAGHEPFGGDFTRQRPRARERAGERARGTVQEECVQQLRQPKLAEIVAAQLREDILTGRLKEGDVLGNQESILQEYRVSLPALREAMRILETEGLITVRRGNVGGAIVHSPSPVRAAQMIAMVLQLRGSTSADVSLALRQLEPICAGLCAARPDREEAVLPVLRDLLDSQRASLDNLDEYLRYSHDFHSNVVALCGNEPMIVVIGALQAIWSAHDSLVWETIADVPAAEADRNSRRASLRSHERLVSEIELGNAEKASAIAARHLGASHSMTLSTGRRQTVLASLVNGPAQ